MFLNPKILQLRPSLTPNFQMNCDIITIISSLFPLLSSGGEGSILGAAGAVIGVGSDIGGSIRMPAFFNGIFGHKTTPGEKTLVLTRGQPHAH